MPGTLVRHLDITSQFVQSRQVDVWLPDGYAADGEQRYPVIYMHDGQNLFDHGLAYGGVDWEVHTALSRLVAEGTVPAAIIVGVWNTHLRWPEYLPEKPFRSPGRESALLLVGEKLNAEPMSDAYLRFLVDEVKPYIDRTYRTRPDQAHTYVMGSSMGGLVSLYALCEYPQVFAGAGCLSTHWPAVESVIEPYLTAALPRPGRHRIYFDYGTETLDAEYEPCQQRADAIMQAAGYVAGVDWLTRCFPGADHSESAWQQRVHIPLSFLLA